MTYRRTNQLPRSWLGLLPHTDGLGQQLRGSGRTSAEPSEPSIHPPSPPPPRCPAAGRHGRDPGVVLEREVLAPPQRNLGWFEEHGRGDVPASRGPVSGVSFSLLHLHDPAGFWKVSWWLGRGEMRGLFRADARCAAVCVQPPTPHTNNGIWSGCTSHKSARLIISLLRALQRLVSASHASVREHTQLTTCPWSLKPAFKPNKDPSINRMHFYYY